MVRLEFAIEIERCAKDIFEFVGNPENDVKWQGAVLEVRKITPGPIRNGSRYRHTLGVLGKRLDVDIEIAQREPHTGYVLQCVSGLLTFETRVQLTPMPATQIESRRAGSGTLVNTVVEGRPSGVARIAAIALSRHRRGEIKRDLETLKQMMESGEL